jgi:chemotaxis signal transduction protein
MVDTSTHEDRTTHAADTTATTLRVIPLRGKEQLALAVESIEKIISIHESNIESLHAEIAATRGVVRGIAEEDVLVLDTGRLFAAATQGMERRRRRS